MSGDALFSFLAKLNAGDLGAYESLSETDKKAMHPLVIMRWMSGTQDPLQILKLNTRVNPFVFNQSFSKEVLFKLIASCGTGRKRVQWIKGPTNKHQNLATTVLAETYGCSPREAVEYLQFLADSDLMDMAAELGWSKEELKKLSQELK
jgi:hypothetical protein